MARVSLAEEIAAVRAICRALGLGDVAPALLKAAHHTTLMVSPLALVARVQSAEPIERASLRAVREIAVARHLAARGTPIVAPLAARLAGPHVVGSQVVTFWPYLTHARTADESDTPLAAATLGAVHDGLRSYAAALPPYTETLDRCWRVLVEDRACAALPGNDRDLLKAHYRRLRRQVEARAGAWTALHGDAHLGNLLVGGCGPVWIDFEDACVGPREKDIAGLPSEAWPRFEDADAALVALFADLQSVCVAIWCWADVTRSQEVREAAAYHLDRVRQMPL